MSSYNTRSKTKINKDSIPTEPPVTPTTNTLILETDTTLMSNDITGISENKDHDIKPFFNKKVENHTTTPIPKETQDKIRSIVHSALKKLEPPELKIGDKVLFRKFHKSVDSTVVVSCGIVVSMDTNNNRVDLNYKGTIINIKLNELIRF